MADNKYRYFDSDVLIEKAICDDYFLDNQKGCITQSFLMAYKD